jgi:aspartate/methionine/tyrosine aminotransferase
MQINANLQGMQMPPIKEVMSWLKDRALGDARPLIDCCQAVPDYPPAPQLVAFLRIQLDAQETSRYSPDEGLQDVRQSVSNWYGRRYNAAPSPDEVCLTIGASQAFWLAIVTLCRAGDEVILPAPAYFDHPMALQGLGIRCVWVPYNEDHGGLPDVPAIAAKITTRTRAILLVTPSNPTGVTTPPAILRQLFDLADQHDLALILDETYNAFLPENNSPHGLFAIPEWQKTLVHLASFGKTFALTGYRAGALVAGGDVLHQALKIQDTMAVCQPRITQVAVRFGCDHLDDWVLANARMMQRRHELFRDLFQRPGNPFRLEASGSFFAWVRHPWVNLDSRAAARRLALEAGLICLPGAAFGPGLDAYLRLAFGNLPEPAIAAAVERFRTV